MLSFFEQVELYKQENVSRPPNGYLEKQMIEEALIRRIAELRLPMMLKGSYVGRLYLSDELRNYRFTADLDWFGLKPLSREMVDRWMIAATNHSLYTGNDGLYFRDFRKNCFWRMIDYAMADDFPTINTDLLVYLSKERAEKDSYEINTMDISFNLELASPPVPMTYYPLLGSDFTVPYTCPFDIQIAWKLHQCIVRPRMKDIVDIIWLLQSHPEVNWSVVAQSIRTECQQDNPKNADLTRLKLLLNRQLAKHPNWRLGKGISFETFWNNWRHTDSEDYINRVAPTHSYEIMEHAFAKNSYVPDDFEDLLAQLHDTLTDVGYKELIALLL